MAATYGPLPLVVGVSGHTDLRPEDAAPLAARVQQVLESLRAKYPHTPLVVVSPLAEGADRLVARVALDLGLRLIVPMPLDPEDYRNDFSDAASVAEFDALRARAERSFVVPDTDVEAGTRPRCYARVGAYVARHCHLLLALWNGRTPNKIGGTAAIVRYRLEGMAPEFAASVRLLDAADTGLVYHILMPRQSDSSVEGAPFALRVLAPTRYANADDADRAFHQTCRSTDAFNAIGVATDARIVARRERSAGSLLPAYAPADLPPEVQAIRALFACADEAAIRFQRRTHRILLSLFWIAFGIVAAFEVFAHGNDLIPQLPEWAKLGLYLILLAAGFAIYKWAASRGIDRKYVDYRALAEGLRVEFYWRVADVRRVAADHCMRYRLEEMEWVRLALRSCELLTPVATRTVTAAPPAAALQAVADDWAKGQHDYFGRSWQKDHEQLARLERRTAIFFGMSVVAGTAVFVVTFHLFAWVSALRERYDPLAEALMVAVIGLSTAAAALIHGYAEQRALSVHLRRYERMRLLFGSALRVLEPPMRAGDWAAVRDVLGELGREALEENADWVMLHRERPIKLPT